MPPPMLPHYSSPLQFLSRTRLSQDFPEKECEMDGKNQNEAASHCHFYFYYKNYNLFLLRRCFLIISVLLIGAVCLIFSYAYILLKKYWRLKNYISKFPSPKSYPIIGSCHMVMGSPEHTFQQVRKTIKEFGSCCAFWVGYIPTVNVSGPEDLEIIMSTMKNHRKGLMYNLLHCWLGTGLLTSEGEKWRIRRKILTPSFHFNILQEFLNVFNEHADHLLESLRRDANKEVLVHNHISHYTLNAVCETAMGTSVKEDEGNRESYMESVYALGSDIVYRVTKPWFLVDFPFIYMKQGRKMLQTCDELHRFSSDVVTKREETFIQGSVSDVLLNKKTESEVFGKKRRLAMLDVLLSAKYENGSIDNEGIREEVDTFIFEGHDTTGVSLCFTLMLLACNKHCQDNIYKELIEFLPDPDSPPTYNQLSELKYLERCIKESLRLYPSVPFIIRKSDGVITSKGLYIPKGCNINLHIYDLHRREDIYPEPEKFDPDRFLPENVAKRHPFSYIPFSAGPRNCIGQKFAMLEMKALLAAVIRNFILEPIDTPETITLVSDLVLRTKNGIRIRYVPRNR